MRSKYIHSFRIGFLVCLFLILRFLPAAFLAAGFFAPLLMGTAVFFRRKGRISAVLASGVLAAAAALMLGCCWNAWSERQLVSFGGRELSLTGRVSSVLSEGDNVYGFLLRGCGSGEETLGTVILYGFGDYPFEKGEVIRVDASIHDFAPSDSQKGMGAVLCGVMTGGERVKSPSFFQKALNDLREKIKINIKANISGEEGTLFAAMILGSEVPRTLENSFRLSGISHLLCISGLHMVLLGQVIKTFLFPVFGHGPGREMLTAILLFLYLACIGFPPAACRAYLLLAFSALGSCLYRRADPGRQLLIVLCGMLIISPYLVYSLSFLLSASAVGSIQLLSPVLKKALPSRTPGLLKRLWESFSTSIGATAGTLPFSAAVFGYVPLFGILASAITVPLMPGTLLLGILSAACGTSSLGKLLGKGCRAFLLVIEEVSKRFSGWLLPLRDSFILVGIFFVVLLLFTGFLLKKRLPALCLSLAVFSVCLGFSALFQEQHLAAAEIRGEESTVTVIYRGREAVVVGMGSGMEEEVTSFLRSRGVCRVAALVLPASSRAVSEDCYSFCQNNEVEKLIAPKENRYAFSARELAGEFWEFSPGRYSLFGGEMELRQGKSGGVILFTFPEGEAALLPREINVPYEREKIIFYNGP